MESFTDSGVIVKTCQYRRAVVWYEHPPRSNGRKAVDVCVWRIRLPDRAVKGCRIGQLCVIGKTRAGAYVAFGKIRINTDVALNVSCIYNTYFLAEGDFSRRLFNRGNVVLGNLYRVFRNGKGVFLIAVTQKIGEY